MQLWEAIIALDGLKWREIAVRDAIRTLTAVQINQWSSDSILPTDLYRLPHDPEIPETSHVEDLTPHEALFEYSGSIPNLINKAQEAIP